MPKFGIEPIILTRRDIAYHSYDHELSNEVRELKIIKTESLDPARLLYLLGMKTYHPQRWHIPIKETLNFPDNKITWIPFAYDAGMKIGFDYIFVTGPPFSSFITGYMLAKRTGKPLILDFRDAWLEFPILPYRSKAKKKLVSYWEEKIVEFASMITVVHNNIHHSLLKKYPQISRKIFIIPNGYDPDDFVAVPKHENFTISFLGTVREENNPAYLLQAINQLMLRNHISEKDIAVQFIGHIEDYYLKKMKIHKFVKFFGHLPHRQAIREFCSSHLAVLVNTGGEYFLLSRQTEYLASGLPIIFCGRSKGIHLLDEAFKKGYPGWIYDCDDVSGMENKIFEIYQNFKSGKIIKGETPYKEYTRENLTSKFVEIIKSHQE